MLPFTTSFARPTRSCRWRAGAFAVAAVLLASSCGSDAEAPSEGTTRGAYATVIRWFVDQEPGEAEQRVVFVEARGDGVGIDLDTQAEVVESTQSFAEVRFIDDRSEAIDSEGVRDGGILLALGPVVADGRSAVVEADEVRDDDSVTSRRFNLRIVDDEWVLRGEPETVPR